MLIICNSHFVDEKDPLNKPAYYTAVDLLRRGDIIGVVGTPSEC